MFICSFLHQQRNAMFAKQNPHQSVLYLHFHELLVVCIHYYPGRTQKFLNRSNFSYLGCVAHSEYKKDIFGVNLDDIIKMYQNQDYIHQFEKLF